MQEFHHNRARDLLKNAELLFDQDAVLAAQAMGADFAYIGSRWLATKESNVSDGYRDAIVDSSAADIVYTNLFTGVHGNYLKKSIEAAGLDPEALPEADKTAMNIGDAITGRDRFCSAAGNAMADSLKVD